MAVRFRIESQLLQVALSALKPAIERIGSTSVPGLAAKPVIDMLVGSRSRSSKTTSNGCPTAGYEYIPNTERALPDRRFFKRMVRGVRTHDAHVVQVNGLYWKRYLKFRNHLRADPWLAARYAEVNRRLAGSVPQRSGRVHERQDRLRGSGAGDAHAQGFGRDQRPAALQAA